MLKFHSDTKIYVLCPAGLVTGGAELLHQLVDFLRNNNRDAYIVYFGDCNHCVPSDYSAYNISISEEIEDSKNNIEILYEGIFNKVFDRKNTQKILWWLSVDNFYICSRSFLSPLDYMRYDCKKGIKMFVKKLIYSLASFKNLFNETISIKDLVEINAINAYQSEYAQWWLQKHNFQYILPLKDYINIEHSHYVDDSKKEDIVLYNPKKGFEFTKRLIDAAPDIQWVPLQGMTRKQLIETIKKAKVYIDFGYHPGKDRLPRECAMNNCCIITGKRGSAAFFEDVSIPEKYKFDDRKENVGIIISTIRDTLRNYYDAINDYQYYRSSIAYEKEEFESQARKLFLIEN